jgi:peptidoglycan/LPS O-acetylase OafA/YrhL
LQAGEILIGRPSEHFGGLARPYLTPNAVSHIIRSIRLREPAPVQKITIADRIEATGGRPTGFDYMRIFLSVSIVAWHTVQTSYGDPVAATVWTIGWRPVLGLILPMFFALSGFLVAGSLARTPELTKFLGLRALRIYPALTVETLISAFILGPLLTSLPLSAYFSGREFHQYLYNCLGTIHYTLPGLFNNNPDPRTVNIQLWTVPYELKCYIFLAALAFLGIALRRYLILGITIFLQLAIFVFNIYSFRGHFAVPKGPVDGTVLIMIFLAGVALFALRKSIILNVWLFIVAIILTILCLSVPLGDYLLPYPVSYMTIYIGFRNPPANIFHKLGDLSYGIFLYGFPMQQVLASQGAWAHHWYISFPLSLSLTILVAWLSWNIVEKPALSLKRHLTLLKPLDALLESIKGTAKSGQARLFIAYQNRMNGRLTS